MRQDGRTDGRADHDRGTLQRQMVKLPLPRRGELLQGLGWGGVPQELWEMPR